MTRSQLAAFIDHTVLKPETLASDVEKLCHEALNHGFVAVCIAPIHVPLAAHILAGSEVKVATVCGFPHGDTLSSAKVGEARAVIEAGAREVDMVIAIGAAREGNWDYLQSDIAAVVEAARDAARGAASVKVIMENAYLTPEQITKACLAAKAAGADYVKTSTGFAKSGATLEDVILMRHTVGPAMGVKAAGGIRDLKTALAMIDAGATRLGCSASIAILDELSS